MNVDNFGRKNYNYVNQKKPTVSLCGHKSICLSSICQLAICIEHECASYGKHFTSTLQGKLKMSYLILSQNYLFFDFKKLLACMKNNILSTHCLRASPSPDSACKLLVLAVRSIC